MKLIDSLFDRYKIKSISAIREFGFTESDTMSFLLQKEIETDMSLEIKITNGKISGKIIDVNFEDDFNQIDDESNAYSRKLNEKSLPLLLKIRDSCFYKTNFLLPQSLRVEAHISEKYKVGAEFLWSNAPGFGVFRNHISRKWFAVIMNIDRNKFIKTSDGKTEILNLKLDKDIEKHMGEKGIYPAYHMNKKNWVTIELNDDIADDKLFDLISVSYNNS